KQQQQRRSSHQRRKRSVSGGDAFGSGGSQDEREHDDEGGSEGDYYYFDDRDEEITRNHDNGLSSMALSSSLLPSCGGIYLVTDDRNLRVEARARSVQVLGKGDVDTLTTTANLQG
ncbi:hypothetical protein BGX29_004029, partial [Mortierella sp. GBA35]